MPRRNDAGNEAEMAHKVAPRDSARDGPRDDIRLHYAALKIAFERAHGVVLITTLDTAPGMVFGPAPERRPNQPRIGTLRTKRNGARQAKRNGAQQHAPLQHSTVLRSCGFTALQWRSCNQSAIVIRNDDLWWRIKLR